MSSRRSGRSDSPIGSAAIWRESQGEGGKIKPEEKQRTDRLSIWLSHCCDGVVEWTINGFARELSSPDRRCAAFLGGGGCAALKS